MKHLIPCFLTNLVKSKYLEVLLGQSGACKPKYTLKPLLSHSMVIFLCEERSQCPWISFITIQSELKSSSPLPTICYYSSYVLQTNINIYFISIQLATYILSYMGKELKQIKFCECPGRESAWTRMRLNWT